MFIATNVNKTRYKLTITTILSFIVIFVPCKASQGDRSERFQKCISSCSLQNCTTEKSVQQFYDTQPLANKFLQWSCQDECKYQCMWSVVEWFQNELKFVPQFYGKWPFVRIIGMQEPASVLASILNGLTLYMSWVKFNKKVPSIAPMYYIINGMAMVGINAWFWSAAFHTRDIPITEKLDYFCALSIVLYSFFTFCIRFVGANNRWKCTTCALLFAAFFLHHIHYLTFVSFHYGYHVKVNIAVGLCNSLGWFIWYHKNRRLQHAWKCIVSVITLDLLLMFELADFSPLYWTIDAHALWHIATIPLPFLWYSFLADDCMHLLIMKEKDI